MFGLKPSPLVVALQPSTLTGWRMLLAMRALLVVVLVVVVVGAGLKMAGVRLPLIDSPLGPMGVDTLGPAMPGVKVEAPGFDAFGEP